MTLPPHQHVIRVSDKDAVVRLAAILLGQRELPCVLLTQSRAGGEPSLPPERVRALLGDAARIYLVEGHQLLAYLRTRLGKQLALARGMTRIYWPNLSVQSDPYDHPIIPTLADEPIENTLEEFARQFDLSRPYVRQHLKLIEDHRAVVQEQVASREMELRKRDNELRKRDAELMRITGGKGSAPGAAQ